MNRQRTVGQYRAIDLFMFAVMLAVFETVVVKAATGWFPAEPYAVSVTPALTAIVLMRWGPWAAIHAILGGLVYCAASGASPQQYFIYMAGNILSMTVLLLRRFMGTERIRSDALMTLLFALATVLSMQAGRAIAALCTGAAPDNAAGFFTSDVVTLLFTLVILWIARRLDGVFEEQTHYLLRLRQQEEQERGGY